MRHSVNERHIVEHQTIKHVDESVFIDDAKLERNKGDWDMLIGKIMVFQSKYPDMNLTMAQNKINQWCLSVEQIFKNNNKLQCLSGINTLNCNHDIKITCEGLLPIHNTTVNNTKPTIQRKKKITDEEKFFIDKYEELLTIHHKFEENNIPNDEIYIPTICKFVKHILQTYNPQDFLVLTCIWQYMMIDPDFNSKTKNDVLSSIFTHDKSLSPEFYIILLITIKDEINILSDENIRLLYNKVFSTTIPFFSNVQLDHFYDVKTEQFLVSLDKIKTIHKDNKSWVIHNIINNKKMPNYLIYMLLLATTINKNLRILDQGNMINYKIASAFFPDLHNKLKYIMYSGIVDKTHCPETLLFQTDMNMMGYSSYLNDYDIFGRLSEENDDA